MTMRCIACAGTGRCVAAVPGDGASDLPARQQKAAKPGKHCHKQQQRNRSGRNRAKIASRHLQLCCRHQSQGCLKRPLTWPARCRSRGSPTAMQPAASSTIGATIRGPDSRASAAVFERGSPRKTMPKALVKQAAASPPIRASPATAPISGTATSAPMEIAPRSEPR